MNSPRSYWYPIVLSGVLIAGLLIGNVLSSRRTDFEASYSNSKYSKLQDILSILDQKYVDSVNSDKLFEETIGDMLHKLDPHSNYIPARDLALINESIEGQFGGIGVRFLVLRDTICVTNVIENSPSAAAGLKAGDKIILVDSKKVAGVKISTEDVMKKLKGKPNSIVKVELLRDKTKLTKNIQRGLIPIESVDASYMIDKETGFIHISEFSMTTTLEFIEAANDLKSKGMKKLVLDLRNNGGGVLKAAIDIADEFLEAGNPIVSTKGVHTASETYEATSRGDLHKIKLVVMINSYSASASEIVAGAIQDNDRGIIVGRRSFGKGLVQEDVRLRDGSDLRLTIARYYTPSGRSIQKSYKEGYEDYYQDQMNRYESGELYKQDTSLMVDSLKFKTKNGRIVYGGGGIMPDVFVPFDSLGNSWYYTDLRLSPAFGAFAFDYLQGKRNTWKSLADFSKNFKVDEALFQRFVNFAEKEMKVKRDLGDLKTSRKLIERSIKNEIARSIWLEEGYFQIMNQSDNEVLRALKAFK
ncbi:MAG: S41 family peptidase [Bacteroidota bacterium]